jgi:hypothetical protein
MTTEAIRRSFSNDTSGSNNVVHSWQRLQAQPSHSTKTPNPHNSTPTTLQLRALGLNEGRWEESEMAPPIRGLMLPRGPGFADPLAQCQFWNFWKAQRGHSLADFQLGPHATPEQHSRNADQTWRAVCHPPRQGDLSRCGHLQAGQVPDALPSRPLHRTITCCCHMVFG